MTKCWFWNISKGHQAFFRDELSEGRLRQGWGRSENLDLRRLQKKVANDEELTKRENQAWDRCRPMLEEIQEGDYVAVKNLPDTESFTIVEVSGPYKFDLDRCGEEAPYFGHVLPVKVICEYNKKAKAVPGPFIRGLNRERWPIRITKKHRETVMHLARTDLPEAERTEPETLRKRLDYIRTELRGPLRERLRDALTPKLAEKLVQQLQLYDGLEVVYNAGRGEEGADLLSGLDLGYGLTTEMAVQIKLHWGTDDDPTGVEQLIHAFDKHDVDAGLLVTFADELGPKLTTALEEARQEYRIEVLYGSDLYDRLLALVANPDTGPEEI